MNRREKILAVAVLLLVVGLVGRSLFGKFQSAVDDRQAAVLTAEKRLFTLNRQIGLGQLAMRQMQEWQARSLPEDREKALTIYKAWLLEKANAAGLTVSDIVPSSRANPSEAYAAISYQIMAKGSLESVVALLYEFYRSPQLHQITRLQLNRPQGESQISVDLDVEALSLPGADATDSLPEGESDRLRLASLDDYKKTLSDRDIMNAYTPPRPPRPPVAENREPPKPPEFDDAEQAHFTAALGPANALQAWINVRTTGETLHLAPGDDLKVGALDGKIVSVEPRALIYEADGKKFRVALGESLRKGKEIAADGAAASEKPAAAPES